MSAFDRFWPQATATLTVNGAATGIITVADTSGFYTLQEIVLSATGVTALEGEVKAVLSSTTMRVGARTKVPNGPGVDVSAFTTASSAKIIAPYQKKREPEGNTLSYVYEAEPTVALRTMPVDPQGNYTPPGTVSITGTVTVSVTATSAAFQYARIAAASITAGNANVTTALTLATLSANAKIITLVNSLNQDVSITYNAVEVFRLESSEGGLSFDLDTNGLQWASGAVIGVYQNGTPPTTGSIRLTVQS